MSSGWVCPGQGMTYPMMHVMLLPPTLCGYTDACENITLPQLLLWAVNITNKTPRPTSRANKIILTQHVNTCSF